MRESPEEAHARKAALIAGIASGKMVIEAAAESGIGWRRAYVWRAEDAAFRAAWDRARAQIKARVPAVLAVPPPAFVVPPSPPLPPEISKEQKAIGRLRRFNADGTWRHEDDPPGYVRAPESDDD